MKKQHFQNESGSMTINSVKMAWVMKRTKNQSAFGLRGSRIFYLLLTKDGNVVGEFNRGWDISKKPYSDDEESNLCISYLVDRYGREAPKKKKEMGSNE